MSLPPEPDWSPFVVVPRGDRAPAPRRLRGPFGLLDRIRAVAFAELQAREGFLWAARTFAGDPAAPEGLLRAWTRLAHAEDQHRGLLLRRLDELGGQPGD